VTAIILAAGVGKRLLGTSGGKPKCLIEIAGRSLLARLLDALAGAGVEDAVVVTGFGDEAVRAALRDDPPPLRTRCLTNPRYREGAILSLWTAREVLDRDVLVMDADVLCTPLLIERLVRSRHPDCFLLDASQENTGEEQMLLVRDGRVLTIVRGGAPGYELMGESIGFLKLSAASARLLRTLLERRVQAGDTGIEHEEVYPELLAQVQVAFERVDGLPWIEIDFPTDVERAARDVLPQIEARRADA
jgi:L-glutamine-phosphate cytidylyltransferase